MNSFFRSSISEKYWLCVLVAVLNKWFIFKNSFSLLKSTLDVMVLFMLETTDGLCLPQMLQADSPAGLAGGAVCCVPLRGSRLPFCADSASRWSPLCSVFTAVEWKAELSYCGMIMCLPKFTCSSPDSQNRSMWLYLETGVLTWKGGPSGGP